MATHFLWDPIEDSVNEEYDDAGEAVAEYTTEPFKFGNLISQHRDGSTHFHHYDGIGSTLALTGANGIVSDTRAYAAFGEITESTGTTRFSNQYIGGKGYYWDDVLQRNLVRQRWYGLVIARWLSPDALSARGERNPYRYSANSPIGYIDPSGFITIEVVSEASTTDCGEDIAVGVTYDFVLDEAAPCDGFLVQQIGFHEALDECRDCPPLEVPAELRIQKTFWEAWRVSKGERREVFRVSGEKTHTDARARVLGDKSCGIRFSQGHVKFFCADVTGDLGDDKRRPSRSAAEAGWKRENPDTHAAKLPSTIVKPEWWEREPIEGPEKSQVLLWWCCCDPEDCPDCRQRGRANFSPKRE